jgi:hypothetical protein
MFWYTIPSWIRMLLLAAPIFAWLLSPASEPLALSYTALPSSLIQTNLLPTAFEPLALSCAGLPSSLNRTNLPPTDARRVDDNLHRVSIPATYAFIIGDPNKRHLNHTLYISACPICTFRWLGNQQYPSSCGASKITPDHTNFGYNREHTTLYPYVFLVNMLVCTGLTNILPTHTGS